MSKKTKGLILIVIGILIALFGIYLLNLKASKKITPPPVTNVSENKQVLPIENVKNKTTLEINNIKYESEISSPMSIYDFMTQLQNEGKITFKEKTYAGMGKFIEEINGIKNGEKNWIYYVNNKKAEIGVSNYQINIGDIVSWKYESY